MATEVKRVVDEQERQSKLRILNNLLDDAERQLAALESIGAGTVNTLANMERIQAERVHLGRSGMTAIK